MSTSGGRKEEVGKNAHFQGVQILRGFKGGGESRLLFQMHCVLIKNEGASVWFRLNKKEDNCECMKLVPVLYYVTMVSVQ